MKLLKRLKKLYKSYKKVLTLIKNNVILISHKKLCDAEMHILLMLLYVTYKKAGDSDHNRNLKKR